VIAVLPPERVDRPLVGFRAWHVNRWRRPVRLLATTWDDVAWDSAGTTEARCLFETPPASSLVAWGRHVLGVPATTPARHEAPASNCGCGLYAYGSLSMARAYARSCVWPYPWRPGPDNLFVLGAVLLWGDGERRVQVGTVAEAEVPPGVRYRAPFARVLALLGPERADDTAHEVGAALGLPVLPERGLEPYAREHGAQLRLVPEVGGPQA
jgi:hypothetical protein